MNRSKGYSLREGKDTRRRSRRFGGLVWIVAMSLAIASAWWFWRHGNTPMLPDIPTAQLDLSSARLVQQHLEEVRSAPRSGTAWGKLGALLRSFEFRAEAGGALTSQSGSIQKTHVGPTSLV